MSAPTLFTYRDAIDHLLVWGNATGEEAEQKRARQAVQLAYREVCQAYDWKYFQQHKRINVSDDYSTGTVVYTNSTRALVLTTGSWPSWARYGRLTLEDYDPIYKIESVSGDTATLDPVFNPGENVSSCTYQLWRGSYSLPSDFLGMEFLHDEDWFWSSSYVKPDEWLAQERHVQGTDSPWFWTIMGDEDLYGQMAIYISTRPTSAQTFDFIYRRRGRQMRYDGYKKYSSQNGSDVINAYTAGTTTCTFTTVSLPSGVVGAVLRTGDTSAAGPPDGWGGTEQFAEQKIITARGDSTTVTVDSAFANTTLSTHFTISDPVDLHESLLDLFLVCCEKVFARMSGRFTDEQKLQQSYLYALGRAKALNNEMPPSIDGLENWRPWSHPLLTHAIEV